MKKTVLIIIGLVGFISLCCLGTGVYFALWNSGFGKCKVGESVYFRGSKIETCAPFGTMIDPLPIDLAEVDPVLKITRSPWTGWTKEQPSSEVSINKLTTGTKVINIGSASTPESYTLDVINFTNDSVVLYERGLYLKTGDKVGIGGFDMTSCKDQAFTLKQGEKAEIGTCSFDGGVNWTLEYL